MKSRLKNTEIRNSNGLWEFANLYFVGEDPHRSFCGLGNRESAVSDGSAAKHSIVIIAQSQVYGGRDALFDGHLAIDRIVAVLTITVDRYN